MDDASFSWGHDNMPFLKRCLAIYNYIHIEMKYHILRIIFFFFFKLMIKYIDLVPVMLGLNNYIVINVFFNSFINRFAYLISSPYSFQLEIVVLRCIYQVCDIIY